MKDNFREWDAQVLQSCLYLHDIEVTQQIRLAQTGHEDFVSWFYEKSGIFTVKSVYKLAYKAQ
jgi:hypothetical protein